MSAVISFESPAAWNASVPLAAFLILCAWRQRRQGLPRGRILGLLSLRNLVMLSLVFLLARPVKISRALRDTRDRPVIVLVDRSQSMSVKEAETSRYQRAIEFLGHRLLPALKSAKLEVRGLLFDENAQPAGDEDLGSGKPAGKRTNLGGAIEQAIAGSPRPPLAVIALTDGAVNVDQDNARATSLLLADKVPFIGVGFGSDQGVQTLSVRRLNAPTAVTPQSRFSVSAELEMMNGSKPTPCELVLFRDGQVFQRKTVQIGKGSGRWVETFDLEEKAVGLHRYNAQVIPPDVPNLNCVANEAGASVRVGEDKELRVLYIQGALTWDYKFIALGLRNDPVIKLTGLTRTSQESVFRQNVEAAGELINGFPTSLEQLAPFRVVVLSSLAAKDLNGVQQELLTRFCRELGGGILMIGGPLTFDSSWRNSRLEQMLPVTLPSGHEPQGAAAPFRMGLTAEAEANPLFQLRDHGSVRQSWNNLPTFDQFAPVDSAKLGARVWLVHPSEKGPSGPRILMATQPYGAGLSAVLCVQNLWRWRLNKDCDPAEFDRFWRQLFRWLGKAGQDEAEIQIVDQELCPGRDVRVILRRQLTPQNASGTNTEFRVQVRDGRQQILHEESIELSPGQQADFRFHPTHGDTYQVNLMRGQAGVVASRSIEVRDTNVEMADTARSMETLRQWAAVSEGLAFRAEECPEAVDLVARIKAKIQDRQRSQPTRDILGPHWTTMTLVLGCLVVEWVLRKKWGLI